jgi:hypothetical protein
MEYRFANDLLHGLTCWHWCPSYLVPGGGLCFCLRLSPRKPLTLSYAGKPRGVKTQSAGTYVDMVYRFFLFILGVSMLVAVAQRLMQNLSQRSRWVHVVIRSLVSSFGYIIANAHKADQSHMTLNTGMCGFLALVSAALYVKVYPPSECHQNRTWG